MTMTYLTKTALGLTLGFAFCVQIAGAENGTPVQPAPATAALQEALASKKAEVTPLAVKVTRNLRAGTILRESDLLFEGGFPEEIAAAKESFFGKEIKRTVYAGRPIFVEDTGNPTVVKRNDIIAIEFTKGALVISTDGRALDPGAVGDTIRIMNLKSRVILSAVITGDNKATTQ